MPKVRTILSAREFGLDSTQRLDMLLQEETGDEHKADGNATHRSDTARTARPVT